MRTVYNILLILGSMIVIFFVIYKYFHKEAEFKRQMQHYVNLII